MKLSRRLVALLLPLFLMAIALVAPLLAPYAEDDQFRAIVTDTGERLYPPHLPSAEHPLGTDRWGYDVLTLMLHGMPYTVFFPITVSLFRLLVAFGSVLLLSRTTGLRELANDTGRSGLLATIPQFVVAYFALVLVTVNPVWGTGRLLFFQWIVIALVGLPSVLPAVRGIVAAGLRKEYVEAARSIGVGRRRIFLRHLLPNLRQEFATLFLFETITVLLVMGQLGIFDVFIGGTHYTPSPPLYHSMVHEWAGLLGQYRNELFTLEWWVALWPLAGYALFIAALSSSLHLVERDPGLSQISVRPVVSRRG